MNIRDIRVNVADVHEIVNTNLVPALVGLPTDQVAVALLVVLYRIMRGSGQLDWEQVENFVTVVSNYASVIVATEGQIAQ